MRIWLLFFPGIFLFLRTSPVHGQSVDSSLYRESLTYATGVHDHSLKNQLPILNGAVFTDYLHPFSSGFPFLPPGHFQDGDVDYDGVHYEHVPLVFDMLAGEVIVELTLNIRLVAEKTASFRIAEHRFERIPESIYPAGSGFFERLDSGDAVLYKKVAKTLVVKNSPNGKETDYSIAENTFYLILKDGRIYPAGTDGQLLTALADKKEQVIGFIKTELPPGETISFENRLLKIFLFYNDTKKHASK